MAHPSHADPVLALENVRYGFPDRPDFLGPVTLTVEPGQLWGVIGPNGAGKSTLLRVVVGLVRPTAGELRLLSRPMDRIPARDRARTVAFLPQQTLAAPFATAGETVLLGRFPHRRYSLFESGHDLAVASAAMEATDTTPFMDRSMATLSGGEAQRVHLAAALAQEPRLLVLDEPTAALDLYHQFGTLDLLRSRADTMGMSVILVTHDLNAVARYCDRLLLLDGGKPAACGRREEVLRTDVLERVYRVRFTVHRGDGGPWVLPIERAEGTV